MVFKKKDILIVLGFILIFVLVDGFLNKKKYSSIKKTIGVDNAFRYFLWSEFDAEYDDSFVNVSTYDYEGKTYVTGSGEMFFDKDTILMLDAARQDIEVNWNELQPAALRIVFKITNALRSGNTTSSHEIKTCACGVDIRTRDYNHAQQGIMVNALQNAGFTRIGWYANTHSQPHIHVDHDVSKPDYYDELS